MSHALFILIYWRTLFVLFNQGKENVNRTSLPQKTVKIQDFGCSVKPLSLRAVPHILFI